MPRASGKLLSVSLRMLKMLRNPLLTQELTLHIWISPESHAHQQERILLCSYQVGFVPTTYITID